ncbi:uncharacterized protein YALI1_D29841g [Yarrowia lipolytica]|uniref:Uncharacterized protein n=1 Tax=Yarrowia lipolytica TaxID=4952 RepID=A0A1D8NFU6_YARLL|nr:hypothetical protein YALI1_D29841g [Yarrowia lipolytica]
MASVHLIRSTQQEDMYIGVLVDDDFVYDVHMYFHGVWVERRKDLLYSAGPGLLTVSGELYPQYGIVIKYNERIVKLP